MPLSKTLLADFRSSLQGILDDQYTEVQLNGVVNVSHAIALSYLKGKISSRKLSLDFLRLSLHDVAFDCIADLFVRDDQGTVVQIKGYFGSLGVDGLSDEALFAHHRRLVCSKVNQGIFRLYNEIDPALGKILRNIKLSILTLRNFDEFERMGETFIVPVTCDSLIERPDIPEDILEAGLRKDLTGKERIPDLMSKLALFLRGQEVYSRGVPLMPVARVFRSIYSEPPIADMVHPAAETNLMKEDASMTVRLACNDVKVEMMPKYVETKKVTAMDYAHYFTVIERRMQALVVSDDGQDFSYFKELQKYVPELSREQYAKAHKAILEYLGRKVEERFRDHMK